jgi:hypothetical protein
MLLRPLAHRPHWEDLATSVALSATTTTTTTTSPVDLEGERAHEILEAEGEASEGDEFETEIDGLPLEEWVRAMEVEVERLEGRMKREELMIAATERKEARRWRGRL